MYTDRIIGIDPLVDLFDTKLVFDDVVNEYLPDKVLNIHAKPPDDISVLCRFLKWGSLVVVTQFDALVREQTSYYR